MSKVSHVIHVRTVNAVFVAMLGTMAGCAGRPEAPTELPPPAPPADTASALPAAPSASAIADVKKAAAATKPVTTWTGLKTPESVLYDADADRYLVSNIAGKPLDEDNNGFISELSPDGKVLREKFIASSEKAKLNAPKGMTIVKGVLFVTDINVVRKYDAKTGASKGSITIPGATFLNDVASSPDGRVFVSDSGMKQGAKDFEPSGSDAVYVLQGDKVTTVSKGDALTRPNGLLWWPGAEPTGDAGLLVVTFGGAELFKLDSAGAKQHTTKLPQGGLDGLAWTGHSLLVSSWAGSAIFAGTLGGAFVPVIEGISAPADIAFDTKRGLVLVPRFMNDVVEAYALPGAP